MSLDLLGCEYVGAQDIAKLQRQMSALKTVPVCVAKVLLKRGQDAIDNAIREAKGGFFQTTLPGGTSREKVKWALKWHEDNLAKFTDPSAEYPSKEDLKKFVLMAYIEWDASETGRGYNNAIMSWGQLWIDIQEEAKNLPRKIQNAVREGIEEGMGFFWGLIPWWAKVGGAVVIGGTVYWIYKVSTAAAPAVAKVAAERYLPPGPGSLR